MTNTFNMLPLGDVLGAHPLCGGKKLKRAPVRRHSHLAGREGVFWRRTSREETQRILFAAKRFDRTHRQPGSRMGRRAAQEQEVAPSYLIDIDHAHAEEEKKRADAMQALQAAARADSAQLRNPDALAERAFGDAGREAAQQIRNERQGERQEAREARQAARQAAWSERRDEEIVRIDSPKEVEIEKSALVVVDAASGAAFKLLDFIGGLGGSSKPAAPIDPLSRAGALAEQRANNNALVALESIRESIEAGEGLKPEDIQNLTPTHIENIKLRGDDYLRSLIAQSERSYLLENEYGRSRER